jgi:uncharacterized FlgJ-related protein
MKNLILGVIVITIGISFINGKPSNMDFLIPAVETVQVDIDSAETIIEKEEVIPDFSPENLKKALIKYNVDEPEIVYKQAALETGHFDSKLFLENNNLFGMMYPSRRETTSTCKKNGFAYYPNWIECVKDMALFQDYYARRISTHKSYYDFLDDVYATDSLYSTKVKYTYHESI